MPQIIPLKAVPNQKATLLLASQLTKLSLYTMPDGRMYMDVLLNDQPVVTGVICQNNNRIVRNAYFGYSGDFVFQDTQGSIDPSYSGLGTRFQLWYLAASELAGLKL